MPELPSELGILFSKWRNIVYLERKTEANMNKVYILPTKAFKIEFFFFNFYLICSFLVTLGLCCCLWVFSSCREQGLLFSCSPRASHCAGLSCCRAWAVARRASVAEAPRLWSSDSEVVVYGVSCPPSTPATCGIFLDQRLNLCPLHW